MLSPPRRPLSPWKRHLITIITCLTLATGWIIVRHVDTNSSISATTIITPQHLREAGIILGDVENDRPIWIEYRGQRYHYHTTTFQSISATEITSEHIITPFTPQWYFYLSMVLLCVIVAAMGSGLAMGLLSIDPFQLAVVLATDSGDCEDEEERMALEQDKHHATRILPLVQRHHLILVTLLISASVANEALPIFLDRLVPTYMAVILSVTLVFVFTEILPSAIFTGSNQLRIAAALSPIVWCMIGLLYIIAKPIAWILDKGLGEEDAINERYGRGELKALVKLLGVDGQDTSTVSTRSIHSEETEDEEGLLRDEITIIHGALELKRRTVGSCVIPISSVNSISMDTCLDSNTLATMVAYGHSRIPVYDDNDRSNIRGFLLVKRLIVISPEDKRVIRSLGIRRPLIVSPNLPLLDLLNQFQQGRSHLAVVTESPDVVERCWREDTPIPTGTIQGLITLEDVLEKLIKEEIADETDVGVRELPSLRGPHSSTDNASPLAAADTAPPHFEHVEEKLRSIARKYKRRRSVSRAAAGAGAGAGPSVMIPSTSASNLLPNAPLSARNRVTLANPHQGLATLATHAHQAHIPAHTQHQVLNRIQQQQQQAHHAHARSATSTLSTSSNPTITDNKIRSPHPPSTTTAVAVAASMSPVTPVRVLATALSAHSLNKLLNAPSTSTSTSTSTTPFTSPDRPNDTHTHTRTGTMSLPDAAVQVLHQMRARRGSEVDGDGKETQSDNDTQPLLSKPTSYGSISNGTK